jgi:hypothetical protein
MKITRRKLRRIIKEVINERNVAILNESATELTDIEYDILDKGPSHPHYHRVARKAERLGATGAGPGTSKELSDWSYKDKAGAAFRRGAHEEFLKMIEKERGMAVIAEPMIALGLDPSNWGAVNNYKNMLKCAMGLASHLDRIIKLEQELIYKEYEQALSGERSAHDVTGDLQKKCYEPPKDPRNKFNYENNSLDCISYRMRKSGKLGETPYGAEHLYDRVKLYNKILGGAGSARHKAKECAKYDPAILKKVLEVQADNLRPMPAYTPEESEKQLKDRGVTINESRWLKIAGVLK